MAGRVSLLRHDPSLSPGSHVSTIPPSHSPQLVSLFCFLSLFAFFDSCNTFVPTSISVVVTGLWSLTLYMLYVPNFKCSLRNIYYDCVQHVEISVRSVGVPLSGGVRSLLRRGDIPYKSATTKNCNCKQTQTEVCAPWFG